MSKHFINIVVGALVFFFLFPHILLYADECQSKTKFRCRKKCRGQHEMVLPSSSGRTSENILSEDERTILVSKIKETFSSSKKLQYNAVKKGIIVEICDEEAISLLASLFEITSDVEISDGGYRLGLYLHGVIETVPSNNLILYIPSIASLDKMSMTWNQAYSFGIQENKRYSYKIDRRFIDFVNYYFSEIITATSGYITDKEGPKIPERPSWLDDSLQPISLQSCTIIKKETGQKKTKLPVIVDFLDVSSVQQLSDGLKTEAETPKPEEK